jgi:dipeptidyl aminopeptidase/acylaminoacyl peptidase
MNGGDAVRVTETAHGVEEFSWSPDGARFAYLTADDPANAKAIKDHDDAFQVTDNHFLSREALTAWHLWLVSSSGGVRTLVADEGADLATYAPRAPTVDAPSARRSAPPSRSAAAETFAYLRPRGGDQNNGNAVYVRTADGDRDLTEALARNIDEYAWLPGGPGLLLCNETPGRRGNALTRSSRESYRWMSRSEPD